VTRVAVDLLGEGLRPEGALDGLPAALDAHPDLTVILVAPGGTLPTALAERGILVGDRVRLAAAARGVPAGPDAMREVRARRDSGVRVAARLVRDGRADAMVSVAPVEAVAAASQFTLGLLPGVTRAALAVVISGSRGPVILCDAGASADVTADELGQFALAGSAYAAVRLGAERPRVGLLAARPGLPDTLRRGADELIASLDLEYAGPLSAAALVRAPPAGADRVDLAVTDGFTGDVLISCLRAVAGRNGPDLQGGTIVLGVDGVAVRVEVPAGDPDDLSTGLPAALTDAVVACRGGLPGRVRTAMAGLVARRRAAAGLPVTAAYDAPPAASGRPPQRPDPGPPAGHQRGERPPGDAA
jgi:phosphate acyltransferase